MTNIIYCDGCIAYVCACVRCVSACICTISPVIIHCRHLITLWCAYSQPPSIKLRWCIIKRVAASIHLLRFSTCLFFSFTSSGMQADENCLLPVHVPQTTQQNTRTHCIQHPYHNIFCIHHHLHDAAAATASAVPRHRRRRVGAFLRMQFIFKIVFIITFVAPTHTHGGVIFYYIHLIKK